jgi:hypothetical protein
MCIRRVIDDELDEDLDVPLVRRADERLEVVERAVARMDVPIVRDVVSIVFERRRKNGSSQRQVMPSSWR